MRVSDQPGHSPTGMELLENRGERAMSSTKHWPRQWTFRLVAWSRNTRFGDQPFRRSRARTGAQEQQDRDMRSRGMLDCRRSWAGYATVVFPIRGRWPWNCVGKCAGAGRGQGFKSCQRQLLDKLLRHFFVQKYRWKSDTSLESSTR